jgi:hypothetical protein
MWNGVDKNPGKLLHMHMSYSKKSKDMQLWNYSGYDDKTRTQCVS